MEQPYSLANEFMPKGRKLRRSVSSAATLQSADDAASLEAARLARMARGDASSYGDPTSELGQPGDPYGAAFRPQAPVGDTPSSLDDAARLSWQHEVNQNGNPSGDAEAPQSYLDSWKGMYNAGEATGPYGDMLHRANAAQGEANRQRSSAEYTSIRSAAPAATAQTRNIVNSIINRPGAQAPTSAPQETTLTHNIINSLTSRPAAAPQASTYAPAPQVATQTMPYQGSPAVTQTMPNSSTSAAPVVQPMASRSTTAPIDYSFVDQVLAHRIPSPVASTGGNDLESWARSEAIRLGIDPNKAVEVGNTEGGFRDPVRQNAEGAPAFGPYQLYVGAKGHEGMGNDALAAGIDPRNPADARRAITFALEHAARHGWGAFQGAAAHGIGDMDGIGVTAPTAAAPVQTQRMSAQNNTSDFSMVDQVLKSRNTNSDAAVPSQAGVTAAQQTRAAQQGQSVWELGHLTPNPITQGKSEGLDDATALAVCGPAAAIALARKLGRNPTLTEALGEAKKVGWTLANGMAGPASEVKLLQNMGVPASLEDGTPNAGKVVASVSAGNPVIISTPGHYFVAEDYDPKTGKFNFGESAKILKASNHNSWFTLDEMSNLGMGQARAALYMGGN